MTSARPDRRWWVDVAHRLVHLARRRKVRMPYALGEGRRPHLESSQSSVIVRSVAPRRRRDNRVS